jgi:hypothetical protein
LLHPLTSASGTRQKDFAAQQGVLVGHQLKAARVAKHQIGVPISLEIYGSFNAAQAAKLEAK